LLVFSELKGTFVEMMICCWMLILLRCGLIERFCLFFFCFFCF